MDEEEWEKGAGGGRALRRFFEKFALRVGAYIMDSPFSGSQLEDF